MPTAKPAAVDWSATPAQRPVRLMPLAQIRERLAQALQQRDGLCAAHCIHELWMRGDFSQIVESAMETVWSVAAESIPDWLPMQYVEWLPLAYEVAARFERGRRGRSNLYLVLLDYEDSRDEPHGVYVGMTKYSPAERFDQHKAGIRHAGSVLRRGLEVVTGPVMHLQSIPRAAAADIEERLAEALRAEGLFVQGGH